MQKNQVDLTTGSILRKLLALALPIMGTQLMQMTYNLTDMFWLGRVGSYAVAASGTAGMFLWLSMGPMMISRIGAEIGASQAFGQKSPDTAQKYAQNALVMSVCLAALFAAMIIPFRSVWIGLFNIQEAGVALDAENYLLIVFAVVPLTFASSVINGIFNAAGNAKRAFYCNSFGLLVNLTLDPLFIFGLNMGVVGAAWATAISQSVVFAALCWSFFFGKHRPFENISLRFRVDISYIKRIFRWGLPVGVESMLFTLLTMIITRFLAAYGAGALAVSRVGSQIESLSWLLGGGFGSALTAFVGQNFGAKRFDRIDKSLRLSLVVLVGWELLVTATLVFLGKGLFYLFLPDETLLSIAGDYMVILAICQVFMGLEAVYSAGFRGTGRTLPPAFASGISNALRVLLAYALSQTSLGLNGIFLGVTLGAVLRGIWIALWYVRAQSKTHSDKRTAS